VNEDVLMFVAAVTGVVLIVRHLSGLARARMLQRTIQLAIKHDSGLTPALLERIDEQTSHGGDDRTALILLALGAALFCYAFVQGDRELVREMSGIALFPIFVGAVLLARALILNRRSSGRP
jgi:hypothetical protein